MKALDVGATADSSDPVSKMSRLSMKIRLIENMVYILPNMNWNAHEVSRYAEAYQPMSATVLKWFVML
jgi:hypothetical protein